MKKHTCTYIRQSLECSDHYTFNVVEEREDGGLWGHITIPRALQPVVAGQVFEGQDGPELLTEWIGQLCTLQHFAIRYQLIDGQVARIRRGA